MHIIAELEKLGYRFSLEGSNIKFVYASENKPNPSTVKPLLEELKTMKEEALHYLQSRQQGKVIDFETEAEKVKSELKKRGMVKIYSHTLGEDVYWARDDLEAAKVPKDAACYTIAELRHLVKLRTDPEGLKQVHQAKKFFGGKLVDVNEKPMLKS